MQCPARLFTAFSEYKAIVTHGSDELQNTDKGILPSNLGINSVIYVLTAHQKSRQESFSFRNTGNTGFRDTFNTNLFHTIHSYSYRLCKC